MEHTHPVQRVNALLPQITSDFEDQNRSFRRRQSGVMNVKMPGRWNVEMSVRGIHIRHAKINQSLVSCAYEELVQLVEQGAEGAHDALEHVHQAIESLQSYIERKQALALAVA